VERFNAARDVSVMRELRRGEERVYESHRVRILKEVVERLDLRDGEHGAAPDSPASLIPPTKLQEGAPTHPVQAHRERVGKDRDMPHKRSPRGRMPQL
jgi:hypothetical protein